MVGDLNDGDRANAITSTVSISRTDDMLRRWPLVSSGLLVAYCAIAVASRTALFADGAYYLAWVLESKRALDIDGGRHFAHLVTQAPLVLALRAGITNRDVLIAAFGLGQFAAFVIGLWICWRAARSRPELLLFPLATFFAASANASFFIVSESHLLAALFWPLLLVLTIPQPWNGRWLALAILLALPLLRSYESMLFLGPVLAVAAAWRARHVGRGALRLGAVAIGAWCVGGAGVAAYWTLRPRSSTNRQAFIDSVVPVRDHLGHWHGFVLLSAVALVLMALVMLGWPRRAYAIALGLLLAGGLAWAFSPLLRPETVAPFLHFRARSLNLSVPLLLAVAFGLAFRWASRVSPARWSQAAAVLCVLAVTQTLGFSIAARQWSAYLTLVRREVSSGAGLRPFEATVLGREVVDGVHSSAMNWGWTMPTLSILVAPNGVVSTIIATPLKYRGWVPFDPARLDSLPRLQHVGIDYGPYLAAMRTQ